MNAQTTKGSGQRKSVIWGPAHCNEGVAEGASHDNGGCHVGGVDVIDKKLANEELLFLTRCRCRP